MSVVTPEEIRAIPERYKIGKRPLSVLLGWGELTYTRLLDGNTPTPAHAAELRRLLDDPAAFARVLEINRDRITDVAFTRSFRAVDALLADEGGAERATRIFAVADRLCSLAEGDLTPSALQRLVYYAQGLCFARLDAALFDELPRAAVSGPVYDRIYETYTFDEIQKACAVDGEVHHGKKADKESGSKRPAPSSMLLSEEEEGIVDLAYNMYGDYSGQTLSHMSREEAPWRKARKRAGVAEDKDCDERITAKSMRKFFSKLEA